MPLSLGPYFLIDFKSSINLRFLEQDTRLTWGMLGFIGAFPVFMDFIRL